MKKTIRGLAHSVWRYPTTLTAFLVLGGFTYAAVSIDKKRSHTYLYLFSSCMLPIIGARVRFEGKRPKFKGKLVVVMNHGSLLDIFILMFMMQGEAGTAFAAEKLFKFMPFIFLGGLLRSVQTISVSDHDKAKRKEAFDRAVEILYENGIILIFPEGERTLDGKMQKFRWGAFRMAIETGAPIQIIGIIGAYDIKPKTSILVYPGEVTVRYREQQVDPTDKTEEALCDEVWDILDDLIKQPIAV